MLAESPPILPRVPGGPLRVVVIGFLASVAATLDFLHEGQVVITVHPAGGGVDRRRCQTVSEILPALRAGDIDLVVTTDASRIARNPLTQLRFVNEACRNGTRVVFVNDGIDTALGSWQLRWQVASLLRETHLARRDRQEVDEEGA